MAQIKVIMFDCDGVMFDSRNANKMYYNTLLRKVGLPEMSKEQFKFVHSHSVSESLSYLVNNIKLLSTIDKYRQQLKYNDFIRLMKIEPTLLTTLKSLQKNFKMAVATNRTNTIKYILEYNEIDHFFDLIVSSSDVSFPKPKPDMLNKVIKYFNIYSNQAIYIGDSNLDELASTSANIPFIAYRNKNLNASVHINSLAMIESVVNKLNHIASIT